MNPNEAKETAKLRLEDYLNSKGINASTNFKCINPSHEDRHPSMSYDPNRRRCHCFSCGADYDIFDVVAIDTGLSGKELFNYVYQMYQIPVEYEHESSNSHVKNNFEISKKKTESRNLFWAFSKNAMKMFKKPTIGKREVFQKLRLTPITWAIG